MHSSYAATNVEFKGENYKPFFCWGDGESE